jgi:two-component system, NarL family, nitrate/nitrite response regulator NarL
MAAETWRVRHRTIGLALADPSTVFRLGVRAVIDEDQQFDVSEAATLEELEGLLAGPPPELALVDLDLPTSGAMPAIERLRENDIAPIVWAKRSRLSPELVFELIRAGAMGVLTKEISPAGLLRALRGAVNGQAALGRETAWLLIRGAQTASATDGAALRVRSLSTRELEVLELVACGSSNREIALRLDLSEFTIKRHIQNILRKVGARSRWEASASYLAHRRESPPPMPFVVSGTDADRAD